MVREHARPRGAPLPAGRDGTLPSVSPATGRTIESTVVSPVALNVLTVLGLPVLVLGYFGYRYSVFAGTVESEGYGG